jgi:hypothetical protein
MVCDVSVVVGTDAFAAPAVGDSTKLVSAASGPAIILHKETGTGTKKALVFLTGSGGGGGALSSGMASIGEFTITSAADNFSVDSGLNVDLPAPGTFYLTCNLTAEAQCSALLGTANVAVIQCTLWRVHRGSAIANQTGVCVPLTVQKVSGSACLTRLITLGAGDTANVNLGVMRTGGTFTSSRLVSGSTLSWIKLA